MRLPIFLLNSKIWMRNLKTGKMTVYLGHYSEMMKKPKKHSEKNILHEPEALYDTQTNRLQRSVTLMGLKDKKTYTAKNETDFIRFIREGLPKSALDNIMKVTEFSVQEISHILRTSDRTLRRYSSSHLLNAEQTERVIELAKLYTRGEEVLGSLESFKEWMDSSVLALGNKKPKAFLDTSLGIDMLMDELGRIEHGVFA